MSSIKTTHAEEICLDDLMPGSSASKDGTSRLMTAAIDAKFDLHGASEA